MLRMWRRLLGLDERTALEWVDFDEDAEVVVAQVT